MSTPLVSVIVPCYNQGQFLAQALDSVLAQTIPDWECIIINDGSTDDTEQVAMEYCERDNRMRYLFQVNQGVIAARNNAIKKSRGKYILPLDGDDWLSTDYLEKAVPVLESNDDVKVVCSEVELFGESTGRMNLYPYSLQTLLVTNCISNSSFFRRSDFDRCGGYNPNMKEGLEDWDFWISILGNGGHVHRLSSVGHIYRVSVESRNGRAEKKAEALRNQIWKNHLPLYQHEFLQQWIALQDITNSRLFKAFEWIRNLKKKIVNIR